MTGPEESKWCPVNSVFYETRTPMSILSLYRDSSNNQVQASNMAFLFVHIEYIFFMNTQINPFQTFCVFSLNEDAIVTDAWYCFLYNLYYCIFQWKKNNSQLFLSLSSLVCYQWGHICKLLFCKTHFSSLVLASCQCGRKVGNLKPYNIILNFDIR